ncbi:S-adenosyl-L-methionine-dependent methyltransferase [Hyaloraphidium curvatum]|nr:S-adenosyl-L-methionine-dependent methyltransferase [Hyaloraphidium curvatum]
MSDDAVRSTNDDALAAKWCVQVAFSCGVQTALAQFCTATSSAVDCGYFHDPFVGLFLRRKQRRAPIINRGSYIRFAAVSALIEQFLERTKGAHRRQILSIGAGSDTRYWLLKSRGLGSNLSYYEVDFPEITTQKLGVVRRHAALNESIEGPEYLKGGTGLKSADYVLCGADLRSFDTKVLPMLSQQGFSAHEPTLVLAECVLVYLEPSVSTIIVRSLANMLSEAVMVCYDPILPHDAFGKMMVSNLKARGLELPGFEGFGGTEAHKRRFLDNGWTYATAMDMEQVYYRWVAEDEKSRISRLEKMDEVEEWLLLSKHYALSWGTVAKDGSNRLDVFAAEMGNIVPSQLTATTP